MSFMMQDPPVVVKSLVCVFDAGHRDSPYYLLRRKPANGTGRPRSFSGVAFSINLEEKSDILASAAATFKEPTYSGCEFTESKCTVAEEGRIRGGNLEGVVSTDTGSEDTIVIHGPPGYRFGYLEVGGNCALNGLMVIYFANSVKDKKESRTSQCRRVRKKQHRSTPGRPREVLCR
jgi:hypothetical protein